jgi:hypothetical protein
MFSKAYTRVSAAWITYFRSPGKSVRSRRARIPNRRRSLGHAIRIGGNSERSDSVIDVNVNVDKSRSDDLPLCVQNLAGFGFRNTGAHVRDTPPSDGNIPVIEQVLRWIRRPARP